MTCEMSERKEGTSSSPTHLPYLSTHLSIYLFTHLSIYLPIYLPNLFIHLLIYLPTNLSIYLSTHQSTYLPTCFLNNWTRTKYTPAASKRRNPKHPKTMPMISERDSSSVEEDEEDEQVEEELQVPSEVHESR